MPTCRNLKKELNELKTLKKEFDLAFKESIKTGDLSRPHELKKELEERMGALKEKIPLPTKYIMESLKSAEKEGADKNSIAKGLAGVGTKEAMEMRERLLKEGANVNYIARSLAGVGTKEAMAFRKKYFTDPTLMAKSFSTNDAIYDGVICRYGYEK